MHPQTEAGMRGHVELTQTMSEPQKRGWYRLEDLDTDELARLDTGLAHLRTIYGPMLEERDSPGRACARMLRLLAPAPPRRRVVDKALLSGNLPYMEWVIDTGVSRILGSRFLFLRATVLELADGPRTHRVLLFGNGVTRSLLALARRDGARFYGGGLSMLELRENALRPYRKWLGLDADSAAQLAPAESFEAGGRVYVPPGPPPAADGELDSFVWMPSPPAESEPASPERLTPGRLVLELFAAVTDRARHGDRALDAVIRLCRGSGGWRLDAGRADDDWSTLRSLAEDGTP